MYNINARTIENGPNVYKNPKTLVKGARKNIQKAISKKNIKFNQKETIFKKNKNTMSNILQKEINNIKQKEGFKKNIKLSNIRT